MVAITRLREFYYATGIDDLEQHGTIATFLSKAFDQEAGEAEKQGPVEYTEALTARERDVLRLLSEGLKNREIAEVLTVPENTVKTHIRAILSKLSLKNRTQAAAYALLDRRASSAPNGAPIS